MVFSQSYATCIKSGDDGVAGRQGESRGKWAGTGSRAYKADKADRGGRAGDSSRQHCQTFVKEFQTNTYMAHTHTHTLKEGPPHTAISAHIDCQYRQLKCWQRDREREGERKRAKGAAWQRTLKDSKMSARSELELKQTKLVGSGRRGGCMSGRKREQG